MTSELDFKAISLIRKKSNACFKNQFYSINFAFYSINRSIIGVCCYTKSVKSLFLWKTTFILRVHLQLYVDFEKWECIHNSIKTYIFSNHTISLRKLEETKRVDVDRELPWRLLSFLKITVF